MSERDEGETEEKEEKEEGEAGEKESATARDSEPPDDDAPVEDEDDAPKGKKERSAKLGKKARREEEARLAKRKALTTTLVAAVVALAAGGAAGWFGHIEQAKAKLRLESAASPAGSAAGPCGVWQKKICSQSGEQSAACMQAKEATGLLTPSTCEVALEAVPATLAKVKAERASCETLEGKLCKDLPPGSQTCTMVKERTVSFPADRCKEMLKNYDQVLAEVRRIDQNPMPMGMPGHGADDGHGH